MDETATLENVITKAKQMEWSASEQDLMTGSSGTASPTFGMKHAGFKNVPQKKKICLKTSSLIASIVASLNSTHAKKIVLPGTRLATIVVRVTISKPYANRKVKRI